jgi:ubiquinone biosynthesis protein Coq4
MPIQSIWMRWRLCRRARWAGHFSTWVATVTARMAFIDPDSQVLLIDAITDGWSHGRRARNIMMREWEQEFARPLSTIKREFSITTPAWSKPAA